MPVPVGIPELVLIGTLIILPTKLEVTTLQS